jgi:hypothetical protein
MNPNLKIIGTMISALTSGALPAVGLFWLVQHIGLNLSPFHRLAVYVFIFSLLSVGLLLGAIFGVGCLILNHMNRTLNHKHHDL